MARNVNPAFESDFMIARAGEDGRVPLDMLTMEDLAELRAEIDTLMKQQEVSKNTPVVDARSRLDKINGYSENTHTLKLADDVRRMFKEDALIAQIRKLRPRIDELLDTANACLENGIEVDAYGKKFSRYLDTYDNGTFVTNSISHKVGFAQARGNQYNPIKQFTMLGINNGGACGCYHFRTDGTRVVSVHEDTKQETSPRIQDMERFLQEFDAFESAFYAYVDKIVEKQQQSVDSLLADAQVRAFVSPSRVAEIEKERG